MFNPSNRKGKGGVVKQGTNSSAGTELDSGFVTRVVGTLQEDAERLREMADRIGVQVAALAKECGTNKAA